MSNLEPVLEWIQSASERGLLHPNRIRASCQHYANEPEQDTPEHQRWASSPEATAAGATRSAVALFVHLFPAKRIESPAGRAAAASGVGDRSCTTSASTQTERSDLVSQAPLVVVKRTIRPIVRPCRSCGEGDGQPPPDATYPEPSHHQKPGLKKLRLDDGGRGGRGPAPGAGDLEPPCQDAST